MQTIAAPADSQNCAERVASPSLKRMMAVEWTVLPSFPAIGRWLPVGVTNTLLQQGPSLGLDEALLSVPVSGLVLLGYTAVAVTLALRLTPKRDVL